MKLERVTLFVKVAEKIWVLLAHGVRRKERTMTDRELLQMALDALEESKKHITDQRRDKTIEALRAALANEFNPDWNQVEALQESLREHMAEIQRLRAALAQPEQEPCIHVNNPKGCYRVRCQLGNKCVNDDMSFRTTPPQREWQGLTEEERLEIIGVGGEAAVLYVTEAKLREKNG
jgi:hypothetical protein